MLLGVMVDMVLGGLSGRIAGGAQRLRLQLIAATMAGAPFLEGIRVLCSCRPAGKGWGKQGRNSVLACEKGLAT